MPLSELLRLAKAKHEPSRDRESPPSTDASSPPDTGIVELVWENGQISMQSQSKRTRNSSCLPSHIPNVKDIGDRSELSVKKYATTVAVQNEVSMSVPSDELGLSEDDDMVPWFNYQSDEHLQTGYCPDFLAEVSPAAVNKHELSAQNSFLYCDEQSIGNHSVMECGTKNAPCGLQKISSGDTSNVSLGPSVSESLSPQFQIQTSFPSSRSFVPENNEDFNCYSTTDHTDCGESVTLAGSFSYPTAHKQDPIPPCNKSGLVNFSHFLPPALVRNTGQNVGPVANSGLLKTEKVGTIGTVGSASSRNHGKTVLVESNGSPSNEPLACQRADAKELENEATAHNERAVTTCMDESSTRNSPSNVGETSKLDPLGEKAVETGVASSSVCSGNSWGRAFDDQMDKLKRKHTDVLESDCQSEDVEEESIDAKRAARTGTGSKRSRSAEVHNLSERRRRDRINEKMRALQELIPNCNKVDKASMLDEAIEYLKTLQLQVQMMAMGASYYMPPMPPMMLQGGMQHMHLTRMAHFSHLGFGGGNGLSFGIGMPDMTSGSARCPMVQTPAVPGPHFPNSSHSMTASFNGIGGSSFQVFGHHGPGFPMSMPCVPLVPMPVRPPTYSPMQVDGHGVAGPLQDLDQAKASSPKDQIKNTSSQVTPSTGHNNSVDLMTDQHGAVYLKQSKAAEVVREAKRREAQK